MASIDDIATVAESLQVNPISIEPIRCVRVRNRNTTCAKCVQACRFGAILIEGNEVNVSATACVGCGACLAACPTEALSMANPPDSLFEEKLARSLDQLEASVIIACSRIAAKHKPNQDLFVEFSCLARFDERYAVLLAALKAQRIVLVDGDCKTCKYGKCEPGIEQACERARAMLEACGSRCELTRTQNFPARLLEASDGQAYGSTRRGFLSEARNAAVSTVFKAAKSQMDSHMMLSAHMPSVYEQLRVNDEGVIAQFTMQRHNRLLDSLDALGGVVQPQLDSQWFGSVVVDEQACNACGMCATFCPTGAIKRAGSNSTIAEFTELEFTTCQCVQCRACQEVCWKDAIRVSSVVASDALFQFEPVTYTVRR